jgi:hypothetical protein
MTRRRAWWIGLGLLLVVLLSFGTWRLLQGIPALLAKAEDAVREEAGALGLQVSFRDLRFQPLHLRVSLRDLDVRDAVADVPLAHADHVDVSFSPGRLLTGKSPVSRILVRTFSVEAGETNRPLLEKLRASGEGEGGGPIPEILLIDGRVRIGPWGPLARWEARIPKLRIRSVRFLGTRVTGEIQRSAGRMVLPGTREGGVPFDAAEVDIFLKGNVVRVRKLRASGPAAKVTLSGKWDGDRQAADLQGAGEADLARWTASGALGGDLLRLVATEGVVTFSAKLEGPLEKPVGSGIIQARNLLLPGRTPVDAEGAWTVSGKKIRLESVRGKVWDGKLTGNGTVDLGTGKGDVRLSLERAAFGQAPWDSLGVSWRPAGRGDLVLSFAGGREKVGGTVSLRNPGGLERPEGAGAAAARVALPVAVTAGGDFVPGKELLVRDLRVTVGNAEAAGRGTYALREGGLSFAGTVQVSRGKAPEYGWVYPLSWKGLAGEWEVSGTADSPRLTAGIRAEKLAARALPPLPLSVKLDGNLGDIVSFVADVPADVAKVTAVGTITGPLSSRPFLLESTVGARDIDFSLAGTWGGAVFSSLGMDPSEMKRYAAGVSGTGTADLLLSVSRGAHSLSGTVSSPEIRLPKASAREVSASGSWVESPSGSRWDFRVAGKFGDGTFDLAGKEEGNGGTVTGTLTDIDLGAAFLAARQDGAPIGGRASLHVEARTGPKGWEIGRMTASAPLLTAGKMVIKEVSAEGSLGGSSGSLSLESASPRVRAKASVGRGGEWPVSFSVGAEGISTGMLLDAFGRKEPTAGGTWDASAEGTVRGADVIAGKVLGPDSVPDLRFALSAVSPSLYGVSFDSVQAEGKKEGDLLTGQIGTSMPDTLLSFSFSLREPFDFRVDGPFTVGPRGGPPAGDLPVAQRDQGPANGEGKARFTVAGRVTISGKLNDFRQSRGSLDVHRLAFRHGGFDLAGERIKVVLSSDGIRWAGGTLQTAGNPLQVSGKATWDGDLDVLLDGSVPAQAIRLATDVFDRLEGTIRMKARITGKWDDPFVLGTGRLENGKFSFRKYAQLFEEMNADAVISREKIIFEHFEGRSGGGYIDGRGELPLRFSEGQKMFFSVDFLEMRYPYPADLHPVLQGHIDLRGPVDDMLVTGDVEIQSALYTKTLRPEQALLTFRKRVADVRARREETEFRIRLDIGVFADGTIHVRNNLAEADVKGDFRVVGDTDRVIILGSFDVLKGFVTYGKNRYELTRGSLEFQDPGRINPGLDFRAETKVDNITIFVSVAGTLEKVEVDLVSDPPYSKNDIVSLLSLGVTSGDLAGAGGSVSAAEAAAFALGPYKGRVEEGIRDIVGLDRFVIEPAYSSMDQSLGPRLTAGKTIGERFSVSVSTTASSNPEGKAVAEYKLFENVYLQGAWKGATPERNDDLGGDVKFRFRYRQFRDIFRDTD